MISNKVCFFHLRGQNRFDGKLESKGGATVAWIINEDGDIVVGIPAQCMSIDLFVKQTGREIAELNLKNKNPFVVIPKQHYIDFAKAQALMSYDTAMVSKSGNDAISELFLSLIQEDALNFMSSSWFESLVRGLFLYDNGKLYTRLPKPVAQ